MVATGVVASERPRVALSWQPREDVGAVALASHILRRSSTNNSVRHALRPHAALDAVVVADGGSQAGAWRLVAGSAREFWSGGTWQRSSGGGVRCTSACGETCPLCSGKRASVMEGDNDNEYLTSVSLLLPVFVLAPREHHPSLDQAVVEGLQTQPVSPHAAVRVHADTAQLAAAATTLPQSATSPDRPPTLARGATVRAHTRF